MSSVSLEAIARRTPWFWRFEVNLLNEVQILIKQTAQNHLVEVDNAIDRVAAGMAHHW